jgi:hypothetical protein
MARHCVLCTDPIVESSLSLEQKIIDDQDFCRRCFDDIMEVKYEYDLVHVGPLLH